MKWSAVPRQCPECLRARLAISVSQGKIQPVKFHFQKASAQERGYILLVLLLMVALLSIGLLAMVQGIESQIKRDREEELIHRGVQYSRAVRRFFVKFNRYPASVEELENTNNIRFLRKRYKDPITGKDFKPLYMNEVAAFQRPAISAPPPPQHAEASKADASSPQDAAAMVEWHAEADDVPPENATPKSGSTSPDSNATNALAANPDANPQDDGTKGAPPDPGGVPFVGVVSRSKEKTIREFDRKDRYNQWLFVFDPSGDANGLINTPDQPSLVSRARGRGLQEVNSTQDPGATPRQ